MALNSVTLSRIYHHCRRSTHRYSVVRKSRLLTEMIALVSSVTRFGGRKCHDANCFRMLQVHVWEA
jgi:hypothetical protein